MKSLAIAIGLAVPADKKVAGGDGRPCGDTDRLHLRRLRMSEDRYPALPPGQRVA